MVAVGLAQAGGRDRGCDVIVVAGPRSTTSPTRRAGAHLDRLGRRRRARRRPRAVAAPCRRRRCTSSQAAVPSRMPTSRSPSAVSSTTEPRTTSPRRTSPLAVLATTLARAPVDGDAAVGRVDPQVAAGRADPGVAVGVLDHGAAVELADADVAGPGGDLGVRRVARSTVMSPAPVLQAQRAGLVEPDAARGRS